MDFKPLDKSLPVLGLEVIDTKVLETFAYEYPHRRIEVEIITDEFTALCPYSGLPDFGTIYITYTPDQLCLELRSVKYYLLSYRSVGIFYEHLVNRILEDLTTICKPWNMTVKAEYKVRGGLKTTALARYQRQP